MDIYDDVALRRPTSFALNLKRLPTELVHQVIEELPLFRVLQILAHKETHLNNCVLSHKLWRKLFTNAEDITSVIDVFILFVEICRFTASPMAWPDSILALGSSSPRLGRDIRASHVETHLNEAIKSALPQNKKEMYMLKTHATTPYPGHRSQVAIRWKWVKEAKRSLNKAKSRQLITAADLMAQFPEKLMLKKPLDPSQGAPRTNLKHIENALRFRASKALKNRQLLFQFWRAWSRCREAIDNIELVPYDRYLWFFLEMLEEHPTAEENSLDAIVMKLSISPDAKQSKNPAYDYPLEIAAEIEKVLKGISFVYVRSPLVVIDRVQ